MRDEGYAFPVRACVRGTVAGLEVLSHGYFCGGVFPMDFLVSTESVGVFRIVLGLDGTGIGSVQI